MLHPLLTSQQSSNYHLFSISYILHKYPIYATSKLNVRRIVFHIKYTTKPQSDQLHTSTFMYVITSFQSIRVAIPIYKLVYFNHTL